MRSSPAVSAAVEVFESKAAISFQKQHQQQSPMKRTESMSIATDTVKESTQVADTGVTSRPTTPLNRTPTISDRRPPVPKKPNYLFNPPSTSAASVISKERLSASERLKMASETPRMQRSPPDELNSVETAVERLSTMLSERDDVVRDIFGKNSPVSDLAPRSVDDDNNRHTKRMTPVTLNVDRHLTSESWYRVFPFTLL